MPSNTSERIKADSGVSLFKPGEASSRHYLLQSGELSLQRRGEEVLRIDERNTPVGGLELTLQVPRTSRLSAEKESVLQEFHHAEGEFLEWLLDHPEITIEHWTTLCSMVDHVNQSNNDLFDQFREIRGSIRSLMTFLHELEEAAQQDDRDLDALLNELNCRASEELVELYELQRKVINHSTRAAQVDLEKLDVPDKLVSSFEPGDPICEEGEKGDQLFILLEGNLVVKTSGQRMASLELPGTVFGEMALLLDGKRHATVAAENDAEVATLPRQALLNLVEESPSLARKMTRMFSARYRRGWSLEEALLGFMENVGELFRTEQAHEYFKKSMVAVGKALEDADLGSEVNSAFQDLKPLLKEQPDLGAGGAVQAETVDFRI